ncbi:unnamed protein product [Owenia fusiformis]|uniref:Uncharacterized protein n=1 Tax=Owenia fusiformis TaxID=6347 RepID=A0A8J1TB14_OWEFU|nr:unnamed protein product [Owenia fusiformis]
MAFKSNLLLKLNYMLILLITLGIFGYERIMYSINISNFNIGRSLNRKDSAATSLNKSISLGDGKKRIFVYKNHQQLTAKKELVATEEQMQRLALSQPSFIELSKENIQDFVFVTAASENHFTESFDLIGSIQTFYPDRNIYYYDLGLDSEQETIIKTMCGVKYRKFNFTGYPKHVSQYLWTCAFKPLIVQEMLTKHKVGVFWVDSSIRFKTGGTEKLWEKIKNGNGLMLFLNRFINKNFAVTHPGMYDYLPAEEEDMRRRGAYGAGAFLIYNTKFVHEYFFKWLVLCALNRHCIKPKGSRLRCARAQEDISSYLNCHRFDQSAFNILLYDTYNFPGDFQSEICDSERLSVNRTKQTMFKVKFCT